MVKFSSYSSQHDSVTLAKLRIPFDESIQVDQGKEERMEEGEKRARDPEKKVQRLWEPKI